MAALAPASQALGKREGLLSSKLKQNPLSFTGSDWVMFPFLNQSLLTKHSDALIGNTWVTCHQLNSRKTTPTERVVGGVDPPTKIGDISKVG